MREKLKISDETLKACLHDYYGLTVAKLEFLPLGLDTWAGLYAVTTAENTNFLLKVKAGSLYEASCYIPRYLADQNIEAVVAPLPTVNSTLWVQLNEWTLRLYSFVEGVTGWQTMLNEQQWQSLGRSLKQIHEVAILTEQWPEVRREKFDATEYANFITSFEAEQTKFSARSSLEEKFRASWILHQPTIKILLKAMEKLGTVLQERITEYKICHADLHPGNLIRSENGQVSIIDWDEVMLAPKERDFLFINTDVSQEKSPFFSGYSKVAIDWVALTYFRCERVIQDLIACAQDVCLRSDLENETKIEALQLFEDILGGNGEAETAFVTALQLPPEFIFYKPKN